MDDNDPYYMDEMDIINDGLVTIKLTKNGQAQGLSTGTITDVKFDKITRSVSITIKYKNPCIKGKVYLITKKTSILNLSTPAMISIPFFPIVRIEATYKLGSPDDKCPYNATVTNMDFSADVANIKLAAIINGHFFETCHKSDPQLNQCFVEKGNKALKYIMNGVPELQIPPHDPLSYHRLVLVNDDKLYFAFTSNILVLGLKDMNILRAVVDFEKRNIFFEGAMPFFSWTGNYVLNGTFLDVPIKGNGPTSIDFHSDMFNVTLDYALHERNKVDYAYVTNCAVRYNTDTIDFHLHHLYNGETEKATNAKEYVNNNADELHLKIKEGVKRAGIETISKLFDTVFMNVPFNEVFPN